LPDAVHATAVRYPVQARKRAAVRCDRNDLLDVPDGPLACQAEAVTMARGVRRKTLGRVDAPRSAARY
jgi:hypothetical protein